MKLTRLHSLLLMACLGFSGTHGNAAPLGSAFSYEGRLSIGTNAANGNYDLKASLYDEASGGVQIGVAVTNSGVIAVNGLIETALDFGAGAFDGNGRWLEISVRSNGTPTFILLTPRQPLMPTPYAITAMQLAGPLSSGQNFLATTGNLPLEFRVNNQPAFRLEPTTSTPNVIGGFAGNASDGVGVTIGGGGSANGPNLITHISTEQLSTFGTIGGGGDNLIGSLSYATIGGGFRNTSFGAYATIGGGAENKITGTPYNTIGGGFGNLAGSGAASRECCGPDYLQQVGTISGGESNTIYFGRWVTIGGGQGNSGGASGSTISGGRHNFISGNDQTTAQSHNGTIGGGSGNRIGLSGDGATIGGGVDNEIDCHLCGEPFYGQGGTIGGGYSNVLSGDFSTIPGGNVGQSLEAWPTRLCRWSICDQRRCANVRICLPGHYDERSSDRTVSGRGFRAAELGHECKLDV